MLAGGPPDGEAASFFERGNAASPPIYKRVKAGYKKENHLTEESPSFMAKFFNMHSERITLSLLWVMRANGNRIFNLSGGCSVKKKRQYGQSSTVSPFFGLWVAKPYFSLMDALSASADSSSTSYRMQYRVRSVERHQFAQPPKGSHKNPNRTL